MNKYNVKAIRDELDKYVANRSWNAFRKKYLTLLPPNFIEEYEQSEDGVFSASASVTKLDLVTLKADKKKLELCRAVVELKKQRSRMTGFTETCPSLLHDLCHKFQPKNSSSSWHHRNRPPPVPIDILEMVAHVCSPKIFVAQYGKRKQTPLSLLLDQHPPAYVVERLLTIMTRRQDDDATEEQNLQVLYVQDASCDTLLSQTIKRLPEADDIVQLLVERDSRTSESLLVTSRTGNIPLFFILHRELKELRYEGEAHQGDNAEQDRDDVSLVTGSNIYQELPVNLLYLLFKTQRAVLLKQGLLHTEHTEPDRVVAVDSADHEDGEGLFRVPSSDSDSIESRSTDSARALQAAICCSHLLCSNEKDLTKLIGILLQNLHMDNNLDAVDENGNSFLHLICRARETDFHMKNGKGMVSFLLRHFPASPLARNHDGKVPLHIAIENKQNWKLVRRLLLESPQSARTRMSATTSASTQHQGQLPLHMILSKNIPTPVFHTAEIMELWGAFPGATLVADPTTGLLPFQLAAVTPSPPSPTKRRSAGGKNKKNAKKRISDCTISKEERNECEIQQVSTVYALLRGSPDSLKGLCKSYS